MIEREYWYDTEDEDGGYISFGVNLYSEGEYEGSTDEDQSIIVEKEPTFCDWVALDSNDEEVDLGTIYTPLRKEVVQGLQNIYWNEVTW